MRLTKFLGWIDDHTYLGIWFCLRALGAWVELHYYYFYLNSHEYMHHITVKVKISLNIHVNKFLTYHISHHLLLMKECSMV